MATGTSFSDYLENKVLDHVMRNTSYTSPATVYAALYTAAPSDAGGGTEVSGGSYARTAVTCGAAASGSIANSGAVTFPTASGSWGTVTHVGIFDASSAGNLLFWGALTASKTVASGDTFSFAIGALTVALD
jgi:hypothetical protein